MINLKRIGVAAPVFLGIFLAALPSHGSVVGPRANAVSGARASSPRNNALTPREYAIREQMQAGLWTRFCYHEWMVSRTRTAACQAPMVAVRNGHFAGMLPMGSPVDGTANGDLSRDTACPESARGSARSRDICCTDARPANHPFSACNPTPAPTPKYTPSPLPTVAIDVRNYLAATTSTNNGSSGSMICSATGAINASCLTSFLIDSEVEIPNGNGIIDYIDISSEQIDLGVGDGPVNEIGVARNYPADGKGDPLRCFTTAKSPSINCTAPPNGHVFGPPYLMNHVPVVSWATVAATENDPNPAASDAWPTRGIPGALVTTPTSSDGYAPANYLNYTVNNYGSGCSQSFNFNTYSLGTVAYVIGVPFGGNIGTQNALVLDGFSYANPSTLERYYYVSGIGRVRENNAQMPSGGSSYSQNGQNIDRNEEQAVNLNVIYGNGNYGGCPQGSAISE